MATGTANVSANPALSTVTMNKSAIPNARWSPSDVRNRLLVKKLSWLAISDGTACTSRNTAISAIAMTIVAPAANATALKIRSPSAPLLVRFGTAVERDEVGSDILELSPSAGAAVDDGTRGVPETSGCNAM